MVRRRKREEEEEDMLPRPVTVIRGGGRGLLTVWDPQGFLLKAKVGSQVDAEHDRAMEEEEEEERNTSCRGAGIPRVLIASAKRA